MAGAEYSTAADLPAETIWDFVRDMDRWAPYVAGYQSHQKHDERRSTWTLKGDVGMLTRTLTFEVLITEWIEPQRVRFTLTGVNEAMTGEGCFELAPDAAGVPEPAAPAPRSRWSRWLEAVARFFYRRRHGEAARAPRGPAAGAGARTRLTFQLRLEPGGPMAPMVNAMITPLLVPAAEDLANRILAQVERDAGSR